MLHNQQEAKESPQPYKKEKAEVKYAGFDDVFALYPVNVCTKSIDCCLIDVLKLTCVPCFE